VVDDITDSGDTLSVSLEYLKGFDPEEVKTSVLIHKTTSDLLPDYYVRKVTQWRWIIFPWHVWEDLSGFLKKMKASGIDFEEKMVQELDKRYGITVSMKIVKEILAGMK
jgi:hypoxanthine phosphoribosyltransferase